MRIRTGWLSPPDAIGGIDHLGTQTPCQLIYQQLMPGITNVTDRARYYSLYPWLIWSFHKHYPSADVDQFVRLFRRADFLLTLIAERHARQTGEPDFLHGAAMAGRSQLPTAFVRLDATKAIDLDEFATREKVSTRYFNAKFGGLGQYYLGTLADLRVLGTSRRDWIEYSPELGRPLAEAVDTATKRDLFWRVVDAGRVDASSLDQLSAFCPCGLKPGTQEHALLEELFLAGTKEYEDGRQRSLSIAMLLNLAAELEKIEGADFDVATFRAAIYTGYLPGEVVWSLPDALVPTRGWWGIYQANELLSLALLSVLASSLNELEVRRTQEDVPFQNVEELADYIANGPVGRGVAKAIKTSSYTQYMADLRLAAPALSNWQCARHEQQLCEALLSSNRKEHDPPKLFTTAIQVVSLLLIRLESMPRPYEGLVSGDELYRYPINLQSLKARAETWEGATIKEVLRDIGYWSLVTHLSVSLRKLRQTGKSTFRFRQGEFGLELTDEVPVPTRTTPRFNTTAQMLMDLGALRPTKGLRRGAMQVTSIGHAWMKCYEG